jgi:hypothetical protein
MGQRQEGEDGDEGERKGSDHEGTSIPETASWVASVGTISFVGQAVGVSFNMTAGLLHGSSQL